MGVALLMGHAKAMALTRMANTAPYLPADFGACFSKLSKKQVE